METIIPDVNFFEIMMDMAGGSPKGLSVINQMFRDNSTKAFFKLITLENLGIRGESIWVLYDKCCGQDLKKFYRTLDVIKYGAFSSEEVHDNINLGEPIPFLSEAVVEAEFTGGKELEPFTDEWNRYVQANRALFIPKLDRVMKRPEDQINRLQ